MNKLYLILIAFLVLFLSWQECKINTLRTEVKNQNDSIENYHLQRLEKRQKNELMEYVFNKYGELKYLETNDSVFEIHRIMQQIGNKTRLAKVECFKDSSIRLVYKLISVRNPLTGGGIDSLYETHTQRLEKLIWLEFKDKINKISSYDLTYWDGYLDCFGGELAWEAVINQNTYFFSTHCNQAPQFTEACEFLLRQVDDKEIQAMFIELDKMRQK
jgi:hypothetical protein